MRATLLTYYGILISYLDNRDNFTYSFSNFVAVPVVPFDIPVSGIKLVKDEVNVQAELQFQPKFLIWILTFRFPSTTMQDKIISKSKANPVTGHGGLWL
jgi:hypothetical protein